MWPSTPITRRVVVDIGMPGKPSVGDISKAALADGIQIGAEDVLQAGHKQITQLVVVFCSLVLLCCLLAKKKCGAEPQSQGNLYCGTHKAGGRGLKFPALHTRVNPLATALKSEAYTK